MATKDSGPGSGGKRPTGSTGRNRNAYCSFCRKSYRDVGPLVEGPGDVYICGECIELCQSIIDQGINRFISNVRFPYHFEAGKKPFNVRVMYHDDKFTYIQARPEETPSLYEIKDRKPSLVQFDYKDGVYTVGKILDRGYLVVGKEKLGFVREE